MYSVSDQMQDCAAAGAYRHSSSCFLDERACYGAADDPSATLPNDVVGFVINVTEYARKGSVLRLLSAKKG